MAEYVIDIPQDHKRVIDNLVSDGKGYLLPNEIENKLAMAIRNATPIKHSKWLRTNVNRQHKITCENCNYTEPEYITHIRNYCPSCGAKMYEEQSYDSETSNQ